MAICIIDGHWHLNTQQGLLHRRTIQDIAGVAEGNRGIVDGTRTRGEAHDDRSIARTTMAATSRRVGDKYHALIGT
jgi:hypothetical protein